jgi:hypothetical protein
MRSEPSGSVPFRSTEHQRTGSVTAAGEIALIEQVHANQGSEFEGVGKLYANHLFENERECRLLSG